MTFCNGIQLSYSAVIFGCHIRLSYSAVIFRYHIQKWYPAIAFRNGIRQYGQGRWHECPYTQELDFVSLVLKVRNSDVSTRLPLHPHGADVSYFSGKVRPAFPHKGLWVREVMPDILEIKRRTGLNYFPVVETPDGETWQDRSEILDHLESIHPNAPLIPTSPVQRIVAYLIELYGDEMGILPAMHYRW